MNKRSTALTITFCGVVILYFALFGIYKNFYAPQIDSIDTGKTHWTTYAIYTAAVIGGVCYSLLGIILYVKTKRSTS